jgi:hypothetical protein
LEDATIVGAVVLRQLTKKVGVAETLPRLAFDFLGNPWSTSWFSRSSMKIGDIEAELARVADQTTSSERIALLEEEIDYLPRTATRGLPSSTHPQHEHLKQRPNPHPPRQ